MGHNLYFYLGMLVGILVVGGVIFAVYKIFESSKKSPNKYDERQQLARGKAYKTSYFVLLIYITTLSVVQMGMEHEVELINLVTIWFGLCLSGAVAVVMCIFNDAYLTMAQNTRQIVVIMFVVGVMNVLSLTRQDKVLPEWKKGVLIEQNGSMNLGALMLVIVVVAAMLIKSVIERKNGEDDQ